MTDNSTRVTTRIPVSGMTCGSCQSRVQRALQQHPGVTDVTVDRMMGNATISYDPSAVSPAALVDAIRKTGFGAELPATCCTPPGTVVADD